MSLKQAQADTNLNFGGATTILGGLGAMVQAATPARLYSGSAALASGLRAEVNQNIYAMLAVEVITKAMDKARAQKLREIESRQNSVVTNYTLERAIGDVVEYHERCSLLAGLQEAAATVSQSENIGIKTLGQTLDDLGQTTTIRLGRKTYNIGGTDTIQLRTVCTAVKARYDNFIRDRHIDDSKLDFVDAKNDWARIYADPNYCKNLGQAGDVAAGFDKRWQDLVDEFTKQTDEKERERVIGLITAQQAGAKAVAGALTGALEVVLNNMLTASNRIDTANAAVQKAIGLGVPKSIASAAPTASEIGEALKALQLLRTAVSDALDKIKATKSDFAPAVKVSLTSLLSTIDALKDSADVVAINAAISGLAGPLAALGGWAPQ